MFYIQLNGNQSETGIKYTIKELHIEIREKKQALINKWIIHDLFSQIKRIMLLTNCKINVGCKLKLTLIYHTCTVYT